MTKKGDLSINIIIIAAIALIILVIISVLLFRSGGQIQTGTSCQGIGGTCIFRTDYRSCSEYAEFNYLQTNMRQHLAASCPQEGQMCCIPI